MAQPHEKVEFKLSPSEYQKILSHVNFVSASLLAISYRCTFPEQLTDVKFKLNRDSHIKNQIAKIVDIDYTFWLKGIEKKQEVLDINGTYQITLTSELTLTEDFFLIFKNISLDVMVWPYLRELLSNLTVRSNLPPLVLPLLKLVPGEKENS